MGYLWIKAAHIISMVCWFAGLFYLPRLFVYHNAATDTIGRQRFAAMEAKLYRLIMNPAMIATLLFGIWALVATWDTYRNAGWLWTKVALVLALIGFHHYCARIMRALVAENLSHSDKFLRIFNEVPTILLILMVALAVV